MDPGVVLNKYIEVCNNRSELFQQNFASNAIVEWYGRTLRGPKKIYEYYRYIVCDQYNHNFGVAKKCAPFETKETHFQAKQIPPENLCAPIELASEKSLHKLSSSSVSPTKGYRTPPLQQTSPELPPITQGRKFLDLSDDELESNIDDDKHEKSNDPIKDISESSKSYSLKHYNELLKNKEMDSSNLLQLPLEFNLELNSPIKKMEIELSEKQTSLSVKKRQLPDDSDAPPVKKIKESLTHSDQAICDRAIDNDKISVTVKSDDIIESEDRYHNIMYLEAFGTVTKTRKTKHRGVHTQYPSGSTTATVNADISPVSSFSDIDLLPSSSSGATGNVETIGWDRNTKLKIAYRLRKQDNDIQFAIIIYEHIAKNLTTRRNLMGDFRDLTTTTATPANVKTGSKNNSTPVKERKFVTPKKSLRF